MATATESQTKHKHMDIKRNDTVMVIAGKDAGKEGRVLRVFPKSNRVLVEHVMVVKKHVRPNPNRNIKGGIADQETPIAVSNIMLVCKQCGPTRVGHDVRGEKKVRICKKCDTSLD